VLKPDNDLYDYRIVMEASMIALVFVSTTIDLFTYKYAWLILAMIALLRTAATADQPKAAMRSTRSVMMRARSARF